MLFWNKLIEYKEIPEKIPEFPEIWHKSPEIPELSKWLGIAISSYDSPVVKYTNLRWSRPICNGGVGFKLGLKLGFKPKLISASV